MYLAQQAGAQGWLVKPLDSFRLKMAAVALLAGRRVKEQLLRRNGCRKVSRQKKVVRLNEDESTGTEEIPQVT